MDCHEPIIMVTDPPYGVNYDPSWRNKAKGKLGSGLSIGKVKNDHLVDSEHAYSLFNGSVAYVWHAAKYTAGWQKT